MKKYEAKERRKDKNFAAMAGNELGAEETVVYVSGQKRTLPDQRDSKAFVPGIVACTYHRLS